MKSSAMPKRKLQITKRGHQTNGVCEACNIQFTSHLPQPDQAEWEIRILFARHECKSLETSQTPRRIVKTD
jgi:hypothetical protein